MYTTVRSRRRANAQEAAAPVATPQPRQIPPPGADANRGMNLARHISDQVSSPQNREIFLSDSDQYI